MFRWQHSGTNECNKRFSGAEDELRTHYNCLLIDQCFILFMMQITFEGNVVNAFKNTMDNGGNDQNKRFPAVLNFF